MNTLTLNQPIVNTKSPCGIQADPAILIIRTYDKKGEWALEAIFAGGAKVTGWISADFINALESDLSDQGWQIEPSLARTTAGCYSLHRLVCGLMTTG